MRGRLGRVVGALAALAALAPAARGQDRGYGLDVRYWPLREVNFPVPVEKIEAANPRPTKLRLFVAPDRGRFKLAAERSLDDLDAIEGDRPRRGFRYACPADGEYDFALQFVFADGDTQPREDSLAAQYRLIVDTRPPAVRIAPYGSSGVEWDVQDENPDPDGVRLEVRWQGTTQWSARTPRTFQLRDRYTWQGLTAAQPLEVRVVAKDKAGLEMASKVVVLPAAGGTGLPASADPMRQGRAGFGDEDYPNRPQILYHNTRNLSVESRLTRVTRSGVKTAHLWVNDGKGGWRKDRAQEVSIGPADPDPTVRIPFTAPKDGLYGFIVIPENRAGGMQDPPRANDPAQLLVEVDTERPYVKVKAVRVSPGGLVGPRVEIEWEAQDKNLMPDPMVLEYAEDRAGGDWQKIADKVPNTGRYVWEVEDKNLWRFFVRVRAVDKAGNAGEDVYGKEVMIDLEKPAAEIDKVHPGGGGSYPAEPRESERPPYDDGPRFRPDPVAPVTPAPAPVAPVTPPPSDPFQPIPDLPSLR